MSQNIKGRVDAIINYYGITPTKFETLCGLSKSYLQRLKGDIGSSKMVSIATAFPDVNPIWLLTGEGSMLKTDTAPAEPETRPHIPIEVAAGLTTGFAESALIAECARRPVNLSFPAYDYTITVSGRSMEPELFAGDTLAIRTADPATINWGHTYVISTDDGVLVKRIYDDGENIRLVSNNPDFAPTSIPKADILALYRVVGMQRII